MADTISEPKVTVPSGLRMLSDSLNDMEALRIATENRYRALTRSTEDSDGVLRGLGFDDRHPIVATVGATVDVLNAEEHKLVLALQREVRQTPFGDWIKVQGGVGEKQAARLLAALGDPYMRETVDENGEVKLTPRTLSQLWSYSGYGDPSRRRRKGMTQEDLFAMGNPIVKMRANLIATSCVKAKGKFRDIYDEQRKKYENSVHEAECVRCGPSGKPAQPGSPRSLGHQHAIALRKISKEILRDLWMIGKLHHEGPTA